MSQAPSSFSSSSSTSPQSCLPSSFTLFAEKQLQKGLVQSTISLSLSLSLPHIVPIFFRSTEDEFEDHYLEEGENQVFYSVQRTEREDLVADIIRDGEELLFLHIKSHQKGKLSLEESIDPAEECIFEDPNEIFFTEELSVCSSSAAKYEHNKDDLDEEKLSTKNTNSTALPTPTDPNENGLTTPYGTDTDEIGPAANEEVYEENCVNRESDNGNIDGNFSKDENFFILAPPQLEAKKFQAHENVGEETFGDSLTAGSTSKNSSEWRSSITYRDSGTEDPFSSSSRRSCPNWESYTMFQKYDEEMMFLDRISAQKLNETESLRKIEVCPGSISQRIVHKFTTKNKRSDDISRNPYHELENAYVAQICLAWEALNWNYKNFQRLIASRNEEDHGCPGRIAQQFQQFQVLLQRYIENEPYEHGRRPEVYARMRISAPKLLQVPEFRDSEDEQKEGDLGTRTSSAEFLRIMEDGIRTFMNFLKADKENNFQIFTALFKKKQTSSVDPTHLHLIKKANKKKKMKLNDLRRTRKCLRKRRLTEEEEMEILMGLIDLKVVSRVLRMSEVSEEQLHWCEEKMSKVRLWEGRLQRDSSPLFFPAHYPTHSCCLMTRS